MHFISCITHISEGGCPSASPQSRENNQMQGNPIGFFCVCDFFPAYRLCLNICESIKSYLHFWHQHDELKEHNRKGIFLIERQSPTNTQHNWCNQSRKYGSPGLLWFPSVQLGFGPSPDHISLVRTQHQGVSVSREICEWGFPGPHLHHKTEELMQIRLSKSFFSFDF